MAHGKIFGSSYIRTHYCINRNCINEVSSSKKDGKVIYNQYCYDCQKKSEEEIKNYDSKRNKITKIRKIPTDEEKEVARIKRNKKREDYRKTDEYKEKEEKRKLRRRDYQKEYRIKYPRIRINLKK